MRKLSTSRALLASLLVWLPSTAGHATQIDDEQAIDIDLKSASLVETLRSFAKISGRELDVHPGVRGSVTIHLQKIPWRQAIDKVCEQQQLSCELLEGEPPVLRVVPVAGVRPPLDSGLVPLLDMSLLGADVRETLRAFGAITGHQVTFDDAVTGQVTLSVQAIPWPLLMEEVCDLAGCRVVWGGDTLHVLPAETESARRSDLVLDDAPLAEALEIAASLPVFGPFGVPEVAVGEGLGGRVDVELENASYAEILGAICESAGCNWTLRYGVPSRLSVVPADNPRQREVVLTAADTTLAAAAADLAKRVDLEARLDAGLDGRAKVRLEGGTTTWGRAMQKLCGQAFCSWRIDGRHLVLASRIEPLATHPDSATRGVDLGVRLVPVDGGEPVSETARFSWAGPVHTSISAGARPWLVRLVWIPFAPDLHVVLPMLGRCGEDGLEDLEVGAPLRLPLAGWSGRFAGGVLEIGDPEPGGTPRATAPELRRCLPGPTGKLEASFVRQPGAGGDSGDAPAGQRVAATLFNRLGAYLLVNPAGGKPLPAAAIVLFGLDDRGVQQLALLRPLEGGGVAVDNRSLAAGEELVEKLQIPGSGTLDLELRFVEFER